MALALLQALAITQVSISLFKYFSHMLLGGWGVGNVSTGLVVLVGRFQFSCSFSSIRLDICGACFLVGLFFHY